MSNKDYSFARNFFSRPENDDTIEQFKKEYMTSMKNYQLAMEGKNRDIGSPSDSYMNKNDDYIVNGSVKRNNNGNGSSSNNNNNVSSRLSSTATLSSDDHQDLLILKNEVKSLLDSREKDKFDKINLKALLNNFDSRLNNLESLILRSRDNNNNRLYNSKFNPSSSNATFSNRPASYGSIPQNKNYWNKDESYDYMLKDQLRRNGYRYNGNYQTNREDNNFREPYQYRSNPVDSSLPPYNVSTKYLRTPQRKYNFDRDYLNYDNFNDNIDNNKFKYQRTYPLYRNKNSTSGNDIIYDDISTIDILNGKI